MFTNCLGREDEKKDIQNIYFTTRCGLLQMNYLTETSRETRNKHHRIRTYGLRCLPVCATFHFLQTQERYRPTKANEIESFTQWDRKKNIRRINAIKSDSDQIKSAYIRWLTYRCGLFPSTRRFFAILESDWWFFHVLANSNKLNQRLSITNMKLLRKISADNLRKKSVTRVTSYRALSVH